MIDSDTRVMVQGVTGEAGRFHTRQMLDYGTDIVAGVSPGHAGETVHGVPVYDDVAAAVDAHDIDWSVGFVPAPHARDAAMQALDHDMHACLITEHIPVHDTIDIVQTAQARDLHVVGPNCPGLIRPGETLLGIMPGDIFTPGDTAVISRSGTLTYEIVDQLSSAGYGQSLAVGIGGDPVVGLDFRHLLRRLDQDRTTDRIVLIGEIGGDLEERAAQLIDEEIATPVVAYIAGRTAPEDTQMGHAGAIVHGDTGTAASKVDALDAAGVAVADLPSDIPQLL